MRRSWKAVVYRRVVQCASLIAPYDFCVAPPLRRLSCPPANFIPVFFYNSSMTSSLPQPAQRQAFLAGLAIAVIGAVLFSTKAIVAKLIYRYPVDAVTLLGFRMLFSLPFFAAVALWHSRSPPALSGGD